MKSVDELKRVINEVENERQATEKTLADDLARLQVEKTNCEAEIANALKTKDMPTFLKCKSQLADIDGRMAYYNGVKSIPVKADDYEKLLTDVYKEVDQEYRAACRECIKKIDELDAASKQAESILREYADAMAYYRSRTRTVTILDGRLPDVYPNMVATRLAEKLQFQKSELKKYSDPA